MLNIIYTYLSLRRFDPCRLPRFVLVPRFGMLGDGPCGQDAPHALAVRRHRLPPSPQRLDLRRLESSLLLRIRPGSRTIPVATLQVYLYSCVRVP